MKLAHAHFCNTGRVSSSPTSAKNFSYLLFLPTPSSDEIQEVEPGFGKLLLRVLQTERGIILGDEHTELLAGSQYLPAARIFFSCPDPTTGS
jgi:hypothetical protein